MSKQDETEREREKARKMEAKVFYVLILEVTSQHICCIPFIRRNLSIHLIHSKVDYTRKWESLAAILEAYYCMPSFFGVYIYYKVHNTLLSLLF